MAAFIDGALASRELVRVEAHLSACDVCRGLIGQAVYGARSSTKPGAGTTWSATERAAGNAAGLARFSAEFAAHGPSPGETGSSFLASPGDVLADKFRVEHLLGRGGMGEVYAAVHLVLGHRVAIKVLRGDHVNAGARFLREAQICARLANDHIIRVFDIGRLRSGRPYIVMECLAGEDLARSIARGPLAIADAAKYVGQACRALAAAHAAGVVHRDLKPSNLFLATRQGGAPVVKVLDFGVSKLVEDGNLEVDAPLTSPGTILGSPTYMSPEQIRASKDVDARSDIWSLGAIFYELLCGRPPFRASTLSALSVAIATDDPEPPSSFRSDLPPGLEAVALQCLQKDPDRRFASAGALMRALAPYLSPDSRPVGLAAPTSLGADPGVSPPSAGPMRHNLPARTSPFLGREQELHEATRLIDSPEIRLVTIVAPGGMGKSRLAIAVADKIATRGQTPDNQSGFDQGTFLVKLAPLASAEFIVSAIAQSIGFQFYRGDAPKNQLLGYLREKRILLVMDNFEHVLEGATLVSDILEAAPFVKVLATSRERLGLATEVVFGLGGMLVSDWDSVSAALESGVVQLLVQGARRVKSDFRLAAPDLCWVERICRLVGGMPLAVVLAAAWLEVLSPRELAEELERNVGMLATDLRDVPERHRSILTVLEYSWSALAVQERDVFCRLSVFRGSFTCEGAQAVAGATARSLAVFSKKALLGRNPESDHYSIHELLRQYAQGKLAQSLPRLDETLDLHAEYYASFLESRGTVLKSADAKCALDDIEADMDNVRAAWHHMLERRNFGNIAKSIDALAIFCSRRSSYADAEDMFAKAVRALSRPQMSGEAARLCGIASRNQATYCRLQNQLPRAQELVSTALAHLDSVLHPNEKGWALIEAGHVLGASGKAAQGLPMTEAGLALCRTGGDPWELANALNHLGNIHSWEGFFDKAGAYYGESIHMQDAGSERKMSLPVSVIGLGYILHRKGDFRFSRQLLLRGLALSKRAGDLVYEMQCQECLANVLRELGDYVRAEAHASACLTIATELACQEHEVWSHLALCAIAREQDRLQDAAMHLETAYATSKATGNRGQIAQSQVELGCLARLEGRYAEANAYLSSGLAGFENLHRGWGLVHAAQELGNLASDEGRFDAARMFYRRSLEMAVSQQMFPRAMANLAGLARLMARMGDHDHAVELSAFVQHHSATEHHTRARIVASLLYESKSKMNEEQFAVSFERGKSTDLDAMLHRAMGIARDASATARVAR